MFTEIEGSRVVISRDPFELLRASDPIDTNAIDPFDATADRILASVTEPPAISEPGVTRSRRRWVLVALAVAALLAVAMAWALAQRSPTNLNVTCYADTSLTAHRHGTVSDGVPGVDDCEQAWLDGNLANPTVEPGTVPPLVACVTDFGGLAVFPTDDPGACGELGLAEPLPSDPGANLDAVGAAMNEITDYILSAPCIPLDEAETEIERILVAHGLADWTIDRQYRPGEPCATVAYRVEDGTVVLVPVPAP